MIKRTVEEGFELLINQLKPLDLKDDTAANHKISVEICLANSFACYKFFKTGSLDNGTGVRDYSNTDYFAVIPPGSLPKGSSDDSSVDSSVVLKEVKKALQSGFSATLYKEDSNPAVGIPFGRLKSEEMGTTITPCILKKKSETILGTFKVYSIANGSGGWMSSSPEAHQKYLDTIDGELSFRLKPLIQLIKAWKYYCDVPLLSFYLELAITKYTQKKSTIQYPDDIEGVLESLLDKKLAPVRDPMGISGDIFASKTDAEKNEALSRLETALTIAKKANEANNKGNIDEAFDWWKLFFNGDFPGR